MAYKATQDLRLLDAATIAFKRQPGDGLILRIVTTEGVEEHRGVRVRRAFPLTAVNNYIAVSDTDDKQIGLIPDYTHLDADSRRLVDEDLEIGYFIPKIKRVYEIRRENGINRWRVQTDRGDHTFEVQSRYDVRPLSATRYLVRDVDGNRFEVEDFNALDAKSQQLIEVET